MTITESPSSEPDQQPDTTIDQPVGKAGDKIFFGLSFGAASLILVTLACVAIFLFVQGRQGVTADPSNFDGDQGFLEYVGPFLFGTIYISAIALLLATPVAIAVALYVSHYAPKRLAQTLGYFIDLLAAIPSVVYGLWGISVLAPILADTLMPWLRDNLGFLPFFGSDVVLSPSGRSTLTVGIVLAVMVLPIITAVSREVFMQTPRLHEEASLALGATRWEMIRQAVIPYGRSGVISGAMLGLGRALGETMAVAIILSPSFGYFWDVLTNSNSNSIAANIALQFPEAAGVSVDRLMSPYQTHSPDVLTVEGPWEDGHHARADALVTDKPGLAIGILTADCGPILFADPAAGVVGAAHSGWKGALTGVLENTVAAMEARGAARENTVAVLGPTISRLSYEVGPEFHDREGQGGKPGLFRTLQARWPFHV